MAGGGIANRGRRIAVVSALAASAALALPGVAASATQVAVEDDFFSPARATLQVGDSDVKWLWDADGSSAGRTDNPHDVVSRDGLFASELSDSGSFERRASAGTFGYFCSIHAGMTGKLRVKPKLRDAGSFLEIRAAAPGANTGDRYDFRYREPGGRWRLLLEDKRRRRVGISWPGHKAVDGYQVQVRSQRGRGSDRQSGWSPVVRADPR